MYIQKGNMNRRRRIRAGEEVDTTVETVAPEDTEVLFEVQDVAELLSEVTDKEVETSTNEDGDVVFSIGDDDYTVTPEEDAEILESSRKQLRGKRTVRASRNIPSRRSSYGRPVRKIKR